MTRSARLSCIHLLSLMHVSKALAESLGKSDYVELAEDYASENTSVVDVTEKKAATKKVTPEEAAPRKVDDQETLQKRIQI